MAFIFHLLHLGSERYRLTDSAGTKISTSRSQNEIRLWFSSPEILGGCLANILIVVRLSHVSNVLVPISSKDSGRLISFSDIQLSKARHSIILTVDGICIFRNLQNCQKHPSPIISVPSAIEKSSLLRSGTATSSFPSFV